MKLGRAQKLTDSYYGSGILASKNLAPQTLMLSRNTTNSMISRSDLQH